MQRAQLDEIVEVYRLTPQGAARLLELAGAKPSSPERRLFLERALIYCGVLSMLFGVGFFIAANWERFGVMARFALLELLVALAAFGSYAPRVTEGWRRGLLLGSFFLTGTLLALFGQTYQTGADTYELFLSWAVVGLPFALASRRPDVAVGWLVVQNLAWGLYAGFEPQDGPFFAFSAAGFSQVEVLLLAGALNSALAWLGAGDWMRSWQPWVPRTAVSIGTSFACWAGIVVVFEVEEASASRAAIDLLLLAGVLLATFLPAWRRRQDVFPLAAVLGTLIILSTSALARISFEIAGDPYFWFLLASAWVVMTSALGSKLLLGWHRSFQGAR